MAWKIVHQSMLRLNIPISPPPCRHGCIGIPVSPPAPWTPYSARPNWDTDSASDIPESGSLRICGQIRCAGILFACRFVLRCPPGIWHRKMRRRGCGHFRAAQRPAPGGGSLHSWEIETLNRRTTSRLCTSDKSVRRSWTECIVLAGNRQFLPARPCRRCGAPFLSRSGGQFSRECRKIA